MAYSINVSPLTYQSGGVTVSQWLSLITLCLAPLIAHIVAGAPEPTYLCRRRPKWHERMCIYSPISILWRYAAITDRRIRALDWSPSDMAAANAIFWTSSGWNGSEEMAARSVYFCARLPDKARMTLFSSDSIKTLIITLQGVQAVFVSDSSIYGQDAKASMAYYLSGASLGTIFSSLSLFGLLRLFAAFWITDEFSYVAIEDIPLGMSRVWAISSDSLQMQPSRDGEPLFPSNTSPKFNGTGEGSPGRFRPTSWWSRIFRFLYMFIFAAFCLLCLTSLLMMQGDEVHLSATGAMGVVTLAVYPVLVVFIYTYYAARYGCKSTLIPCMGRTWYKVLTAVIFLSWTVFPILSAIETRRTPCGKYTTSLSGSGDDAILCPGLVYVGPSSRPGPFGLVSDAISAANVSSPPTDGNLTMTLFTGFCQGVSGETDTIQVLP
ncbi:hypothetical protein B0T16DRAFT_462327 [Cercophora newfieldiana]|uniref:Uncharacterized protein n=1 Tax=Cercophora newfieldiana TaxID=92897 RepID=A0AA40CHE8_9PEZI|nr:hypothetical protein B0T16DRAFT_462327 [Cercophora newfieldiana]